MSEKDEETLSKAPTLGRCRAILDVALVFLIFFLYAASPTPGANEAHYLAKAKHYWNPQWCPHDHFLNSADAHAVFYWTFGWLTLFFPLPVVAWSGRLLTWGLLAWSWRRLSFSLFPAFGFAALSAGLFVTLMHWGHMAGEWVIGGVEAKGFAYVLVFLALEAAQKNRWQKTILLLGAATSFHVLVGGWAMIAAALAWLGCGSLRPPVKTLMLPIFGAVLLSLPGIVPALAMTWKADALTIQKANEIYVYGRLGHHLLFHRFVHDPTQPYVLLIRHMVLLVMWLALGVKTPCQISEQNLGQRPLRGFVGGAIVIAILGAILDQVLVSQPKIAAPLMKYYWFRLSDVMMPLGVAIAWVGVVVDRNFVGRQMSQGIFRQFFFASAILLVTTQLVWSSYGNLSDFRRGAKSLAVPVPNQSDPRAAAVLGDWRRACEWINNKTPPDSIFMTPRWQQTFKWLAQRAEVATWKDVPQDPISVVEWWERIGLVYVPDVSVKGLSAHSDERLLELAESFDVDFVLLDRFLAERDLPWQKLYPNADEPNASFSVYRIPRARKSKPQN